MKSTRLIALAAAGIMCAAMWVWAGTTGIVSGFVKGDDGKPVSGANVIVTGTKLTTVTDANGYYVLTNVPPGDYEVRAEMVGYATASVEHVSVTMDATATVDFGMRPEAIKEATALVTRPRPMIVADQVNTLSLMTNTQENLTRTDATGVNTVPGVLSTLPGVFVEPNQTGLMHIRGGRYDQIGYYIEGFPITDPNGGLFSDNGFSTGVSRFQAYTGGFGAEFGNAIAGVLNEVKKSGETASGFRMATFGGSDAYRSAQAEFGGGNPSGFNYYAGTVLQQNDISGSNFLAKQDYYDNCVKLVWPGQQDTFTLLALQGTLNGDVGGPGLTLDGDFTTQKYSIVGGIWNHSFDSQSFVAVRPYYIYCSTLQSMTHNAPMPYVNDGTSHQAGLTVGYTNQLSDRKLLKFGGSLLASDNSQKTQNPLYVVASSSRADVDTFGASLYAEQQLKFASKWTLNTGARMDKISYDRKSLGGVGETSWTPRLGLSYAADSRTVWKASWGKYTRFVPANTIAATNQVDDGMGGMTSSVVLGDGSPQRSTAGEISFEKQINDSVAYRVTPFYADYRNLSDYTYDAFGFPHYVNVGKGESRGVEFYVRKRVSSNWQGWLAYTFQTVKAGTGNTALKYTSWDQRNTLCAVADYKLGSWEHTMRADFGSGIANADKGRRADPRCVLTYGCTYSLPKSVPADSLTLSIYNIFDDRQVTQYQGNDAYSTTGERFISLGVNRSM